MNSGNPAGDSIVQLPGGAHGVVVERSAPSSYSHTVEVAHLQTYLDTEETSDVSTQAVHTANLTPVGDVETVADDVWGGEAPDRETLETLS